MAQSGQRQNSRERKAMDAETVRQRQQQQRGQRAAFDQGVSTRVGSGRAMVAEHGYDPTAHDRHDKQQRVQTDLQSEGRRHRQPAGERARAQALCDGDDQQHGDKKVVATVGTANQRPSEPQRCEEGKRHPNQRRQHGPRGKGQHPCRQPHERQRHQRRTRWSRSTAPVAPRREQKADHDGHSVAKQHLVGVPGAGARGAYPSRVLHRP